MLFRTCLLFWLMVCAFADKDAPASNDAADSRLPSDRDGPVTVAPSGRFRGSWMTSRRGRPFQAYRGIRYAEPPVGALRFQPPKPILTYSEVVDASEDGPGCPRPAPPEAAADEDCLTVNVYTPSNNRLEPLPVIFYIHAGGLYSMTGRSDVVGPHYLLDKDLVLVTINYRLGSLGFLSTGDELAPGNNGYKDQVAALKWVQRNIRAFGGDPELVTIAGCSAGSHSILLHMASPMSKGLFHRGISMSGSPIYKEPLTHDLYQLAVKQAQLLNCPVHNSSAILNCLMAKPWQEFGTSVRGFYEFGFDPVSIWRPVVEQDFGQERFLTTQPVDAIREGALVTPVPHLISQTTDEFFWKAFTILNNATLLKEMNDHWDSIAPISFHLPRHDVEEPARRLKAVYLGGKQLVNDGDSARGLGKLYGDAITGFHVHRMANLMCRRSPHKVWYYEFAYVGNHSHYQDPVTKKPTNAAHHDDLIYLFSLSFRFPAILADDSQDSKMVDQMTDLWYNFAKHGDPNPCESEESSQTTLKWPTMKHQDRKYLRLADQPSIRTNMFEDRFKLWEELYPLEY